MDVFYLRAADAIVVVHAAYVGFVVFGLVAILAGIALGWKWVRNFWFRIIHFLMIAIVAGEALGGVFCPLTTWENDLRELGGEHTTPRTFIGRVWESIMVYRPTVDEDTSGMSAAEVAALKEKKFQALQDKLAVVHCVFGAVVLLTLVLAPPRRLTGPRWLVGPRKLGG
jgi:hypothetical protein